LRPLRGCPGRLAASLILGIFAGCGTVGPATPGPEGAGPVTTTPPQHTLVVSVNKEPASLAAFSPAASGLSTAFPVRPFNAFLELVDDRAAAHPYLAESLPKLGTDSWVVYPDGRMQTTYRLKPNVVWHDGAPFSAADLVFAYRLYTTPELGFAAASTVPISAMEDVEAPDDSTLVIRWKRSYPGAGVLQVGGSTNLGLPPVPRHLLGDLYADSQWTTLANHAYWTVGFVGLGPFRLDRWEQGSFIEGVAFDGHVLGRPRIDRIHIVFIADANAAVANVRAGTVDLATEGSLTFEQALELKREWASSHAGTFLWTAASIRHFVFQFRPELVSPSALLDLRVRKALIHSLDRSALNDALWGGEGILLDSIFSPRVEYYPAIDGAVTKYPYSLSAADGFMTEAGFRKGPDGVYTDASGARLVLEVRSTGGGTSDTERSVAASGWRQAGFDAQEGTLAAALALDAQERASFPAISTAAQSATDTTMSAAFTTPQIARPENRWNGINRGAWSDPEYDRLVESFNTTLDPTERIQQRASMARVLSDELPAIMLYYNLNPAPFLARLTGPVPTTPDSTGYVGWNIHEWEIRD